MVWVNTDPGGVVEENTEIDRVIASVVYPAAELAEPGVVRHIEGDRFSLGELDGVKTERIGPSVVIPSGSDGEIRR